MLTHLVLDDAQEASNRAESALAWSRARALAVKEPDLRLVLVSATPNLALISAYFAACGGAGGAGCWWW